MTVTKLFLYIGIVAFILTVVRYLFQDYKKVVLSYLQNFVGTLFLFSGFVKAVDPMGTSIKMHEYFEAMHIEFFNPVSTPLTVAMLVAELTLGLALLTGFKPKITTSLLLLLNVFFLLLTGYTKQCFLLHIDFGLRIDLFRCYHRAWQDQAPDTR
jgi:uncharacterized membrane protein YphA (DoxX/SURF4 family)